jgi:hypothetical protein
MHLKFSSGTILNETLLSRHEIALKYKEG